MAPQRDRNEPASLASTASDQIRAILDAAEQTAAQIRAQAEEEAGRIRAAAEEEATGIRSQARSDVRGLIESIRTGLSGVRADLEVLENRLTAPDREAVAPAPVGERLQGDEAVPPGRSPEPAAREKTAAVPEPTAAPPDDADLESARLVALNMALDGAERQEVDRYLSENFAVSNRQELLDEVYASLGP